MAATGFSGIYMGIGRTGFGVRASVGAKFLTFFSNGLLYFTRPPQGLYGFDPKAESRLAPNYWAVFQVRDSSMLLTLPRTPNDPPTILPIKDGSVRYMQTDYSRVDPCDGLRLAGTYRRDGWRTLSEPGRKGITLTADGKFQDEAVIRAAGFDFVGDKTVDRTPGSGTYNIQQNSLILSYSDGRKKVIFFYLDPAPPGDKTSAICLNEYRFLRQ